MAELEIRDPIIKLFGKRISLPINHKNKYSDCKLVSSEPIVLHEKETEKQGNDRAKQITDQTSSEVSENPLIEKEISSPKSTKNEKRSETSTSPDDKTSKKPDKILPCPRCKSMDTKFCYYNNYNVNQPRHFCKNCQRYWTAGGTMRNVPVGAGRRKNKSSSFSHFRQLILPDRHQILTFGSNSSVPDSQKLNRNGFLICIENGGDNLTDSSISASNSSDKESKLTSHKSLVKNVLPFSPQLQSFNGFPWPSPPSFFPTGFPVYYPASPYWGYTMPPSWTVTNLNDQESSTNSSALGKRLRDDEIVKQSKLKMDDPNKVAKSSILSTHGGGLFGSFKQTANGKDENHIECCSLLHANPAAFSRASKFREIA